MFFHLINEIFKNYLLINKKQFIYNMNLVTLYFSYVKAEDKIKKYSVFNFLLFSLIFFSLIFFGFFLSLLFLRNSIKNNIIREYFFDKSLIKIIESKKNLNISI